VNNPTLKARPHAAQHPHNTALAPASVINKYAASTHQSAPHNNRDEDEAVDSGSKYECMCDPDADEGSRITTIMIKILTI
jgi:hypothetical protein